MLPSTQHLTIQIYIKYRYGFQCNSYYELNLLKYNTCSFMGFCTETYNNLCLNYNIKQNCNGLESTGFSLNHFGNK